MNIVCFSHLRWQFVYQRPNHLMARAGRDHTVHFIEEPEHFGTVAHVDISERDGLRVVRPVLPAGLEATTAAALQRELVSDYLADLEPATTWLWYYTPMALGWTGPLAASVVVYDCMDELSAFRAAPLELRRLEAELLARADIVFTGGRSLYESKRDRHPNAHLFPSSVDTAHFGKARQPQPDPTDQAPIGRPRIGYFGVIDERLDLELVAAVADARPEWQLIMVGPLAKLDEADLPRRPNIHWLGLKPYAELPAYLAGWDVAMMPFAINEATRFISPTKTPEYLAGGRPVVSTPVPDVVQPYGEAGLVAIAADAPGWVSAIEAALGSDLTQLMSSADRLLASQSWDRTWRDMERLAFAAHWRRLAGAAPLDDVAPAPARPLTGLPLPAGGRLAADLVSQASHRARRPAGGSVASPRFPRARS